MTADVPHPILATIIVMFISYLYEMPVLNAYWGGHYRPRACSPKLSHGTNELTTYTRVLLEKLIISQVVNKFLPFCGTRRIITTFTRTLYCSQSWTTRIQYPICSISVLILSTHLCLCRPSSLFPSRFRLTFCMHFLIVNAWAKYSLRNWSHYFT
jgi:hypothetical protein